MDIHAPEGPVHNWREFAVHIAIVTIGILIALSLEGLRESIHNRHLVREARDTFSRELENDLEHLRKESPAVKQASKDLQKLAADLPALAHAPEDLKKRLKAIHDPFYVFNLGSWQSALSTGALAHMSPDEVAQYAGADNAVRIYANLQRRALDAQSSAISFFEAHANLSSEEIRAGNERLLFWLRDQDDLAYYVDQLGSDLDAAYSKAKQ